jgi:hypothetical protein
MPFVCAFVCGKQCSPINRKMDFRRADPRYVNFVPKTCVDAIDLFNRHRNLGLKADLYPECFVHCARALPDGEMDKFHRFIVCPSGDIENGGESVTDVDMQLDAERRELLQESERRDALASVSECPADEEKSECPTEEKSEKDYTLILNGSS